jgi:hypothetical protein
MQQCLLICSVLVAIAVFLSFFLLHLLVCCTKGMIIVSLWSNVVVCVGFTGYALWYRQYIVAIVAGVLALLSIWYDIDCMQSMECTPPNKRSMYLVHVPMYPIPIYIYIYILRCFYVLVLDDSHHHMIIMCV